MRVALLFVAAVVLGCKAGPEILAQSPSLADSLEAMMDAERAFARAAREVGTRDAFLRFFSDEAIGFAQEAGPAKAQIRRWPDPKPGVVLEWEPRAGDIARSGDLGVLTGPARRVAPGAPDLHMCYASIWKRQADGSYRVMMDVGIQTPAPPRFGPEFERLWNVARFTGAGGPAPARSLEESDRALGTRLRSSAQGAAYWPVLARTARLHRSGVLPVVGATAVGAWLAAAPPLLECETMGAEAAEAGDFGYTWGRYAARASTAAEGERGFYMRAWGRDADGAWRLLLDVTKSVG